MVAALNPKIRGWSNYHSHVVSKQTFSYVDHQIHKCLRKWAERRHPLKGSRWVKDKYFVTHGGDNWVFCGVEPRKEGVQKRHLTRANSTPIRRHIKVKGEANPYDPQWEIYFEERLSVKMEKNLRGRRLLLYLWKSQNGRCPVCDKPITKLTGWHSHHIVWRVMGGPDGVENRVLLHPECHRKVHSQGLTVTKPRP